MNRLIFLKPCTALKIKQIYRHVDQMLASDGKRKGLSLFHSPGQQQIQVYFNLLQGSLEKEQSRYNVFGSYIIHSPYQNYKKLKSEKL